MTRRDKFDRIEEDGLSIDDRVRGTGYVMAWARFPYLSNLTDCRPWWSDSGVPALLSPTRMHALL
jgi:hypothetical protein